MNNVRKYFYLFLLVSIYFFGMEEQHDTISKENKRIITQTKTIDGGADVFNVLVAIKEIAPTLANTRWCIYTLIDKSGNSLDNFTVALKLNTALACAWLEEYVKTEEGFNGAANCLRKAVATNNNELLAIFLLSTRDSRLANLTIPNGPIIHIPLAHYCAYHNKWTILNCLLSAGANPTWHTPHDGFAPLHVAAFQGNPEAMEILLKYVADPDYLTLNTHQTSLMLLGHRSTINQNHIQIARMLLDAGADRTKTDSQGYTAAQQADLLNIGGLKAQLKNFIDTYNPKKKIE